MEEEKEISAVAMAFIKFFFIINLLVLLYGWWKVGAIIYKNVAALWS